MSSKEWKSYKISDVGKIITGKTPPTQNSSNFGFKYPFITPRDMLGQKKIHQTERYLSEEGKNTVRNCLLPMNSICVSCIGSDMGKVVMTTKNSVTNQQLNSIICGDFFDPDFVYYALINISGELKNVGHHSTAVPILNKTDFSNFEIIAPDIVTQRRIADILSALDEKIELNRQVNVTLEAMAQAIFREWFVDFNLPAIGVGADLKSAPTGTIPQGWRVGKLGEIYKTASGGTPSRARNEYYENGTYQWVKSKELNGSFIVDTEEKITDDALKNSSAKLLPKHSVLVAMYGATVGEIGIISNEATTNQAVCAFIPNGDYPFSFIFQFLKNNKDDIISRAVGSAQQNISQELLKNLEVIIPESNLLKKYHTVVEPIFLAIEENIKQTATLAAVRDALLPKLMSGEIGV